MIRPSLFVLFAAVLTAVSSATGFTAPAVDIPPPIATSLARQVHVTATTIVSLQAHLRFGTLIVLPPTERIVHALCGDPDWWQVSVVDHRVSVKPAKVGASTNLTLITAHGGHYMFVLTEVSERAGVTADLELLITPDAAMTSAATPPQWVPASELARAQTDASAARADAHATAERWLTTYPPSLRFAYTFERRKRPFWIEAMWDDGVRTYLRTRAPELPALYEIRDGQPSLVQFEVRAGDPRQGQTYIVPKILDAGYLMVGKQRTTFRREY